MRWYFFLLLLLFNFSDINSYQYLGTSPGAIAATYKAGSNITVTWKTTIVHPSSPGVRIAVRYSDSDNFNNNVLASGVDIGPVGKSEEEKNILIFLDITTYLLFSFTQL